MKESIKVTYQTKVAVVNNALEVSNTLNHLISEGYHKDNLYVLTHDDDRTEHISEATNAKEIGILEEGPITAIANLFRSQGDELRAKLRSMGVSKEEAERLESEMDKGKVIVLAWGGKVYEENSLDSDIMYNTGPWV